MTSQDPFYTPVQPKANTCSHCWFNPRASRHTVSFYEYPCGKKHLAHQKCFQAYVKSPLSPCRMCQREFGTIINVNPIPKAKDEVQTKVQTIKETQEEQEKKKKDLKTRIILSLIIIFVIGIALLFVLTL